MVVYHLDLFAIRPPPGTRGFKFKRPSHDGTGMRVRIDWLNQKNATGQSLGDIQPSPTGSNFKV
jgi:hypothetical protein